MADEVVSQSDPHRRARRRSGAPRGPLGPPRPDEGVVPAFVGDLPVVDVTDRPKPSQKTEDSST